MFLFFRKQYSSFRVAPAVSVDGNVTLGENIADQGGLRIAEIAYEKWLQSHAETAHSLPALEFTHRQLFYLGYALPWCATHTDAMMRYLQYCTYFPDNRRDFGRYEKRSCLGISSSPAAPVMLTDGAGFSLGRKDDNRVTLQVSDLGWVEFDFGYSTVCRILLGADES